MSNRRGSKTISSHPPAWREMRRPSYPRCRISKGRSDAACSWNAYWPCASVQTWRAPHVRQTLSNGSPVPASRTVPHNIHGVGVGVGLGVGVSLGVAVQLEVGVILVVAVRLGVGVDGIVVGVSEATRRSEDTGVAPSRVSPASSWFSHIPEARCHPIPHVIARSKTRKRAFRFKPRPFAAEFNWAELAPFAMRRLYHNRYPDPKNWPLHGPTRPSCTTALCISITFLKFLFSFSVAYWRQNRPFAAVYPAWPPDMV